MIHGWRARLHYLSRHGDTLKKTALGIVLGSFALAWVIVSLAPKKDSSVTLDPLEQKVREDWQNLRQATAPKPRDLSRWLRLIMRNTKPLAEALDLEPPTQASFEQTGKLLCYEIAPLIKQHVTEAGTVTALGDYTSAYLGDQESQALAAAERLRLQAEMQPPPALTNELYASLLLRAKRDSEALTALLREGSSFADAKPAREAAAQLALKLDDKQTLQLILTKGWLSELPPLFEHLMGTATGDLLMQWRGMLKHRLATMPLHLAIVALAAAALWYLILVQHIPAHFWRWVWPILPLCAGIASIWPTVTILLWQQDVMGLSTEADFPWDLWSWIVGVGLREELCKLALASLFMPWLLWRRTPGMALMTGAFVGLGFALEENINYYADYGDGVALVRFLSANFMHVAMTGLTTHALYDMLRSRFHQAQQCIITVVTVIVAHGLYDYDIDLPSVQGIDAYVHIIILAMLSWRFWDLVEAEMPQARQLISPAAVFLLGTATVIAASLFISAYQVTTRESLVKTAIDCASFLPVALIYWRRFERTSCIISR